MFRKWIGGLVTGLLLGSLLVASPTAQNYIWTTINGVPYSPSASIGGNLTIGAGGAIDMGNAAAIRTGTTAADTLLLQAYDTDTGPAYTTLLTLTAGTSPSMTGLFGAGTAAAPSVAMGATNRGFSSDGNGFTYSRSGAASIGLYIDEWYIAAPTGQFQINNDLRITREAAATLQLGTDVNGAAVAQTIKAHDGITGTDIAGANFILAGGRGTGAGASGLLYLQTATLGSTGTTAQTLVTDEVIGVEKVLTDNSAIDLFEIALPAAGMVGGHIFYTIVASDGTDHQSHTGVYTFSAVNKAGSYTTDGKEPVTAESAALSSGTLTDTFAVTGGTNKITISLNANSSLTPTNIRVYYSVKVTGPRAITIL